MTMLEYTKVILEKVSFEPRIFKKELRKAMNYVTKEEYGLLKIWVKKKFGKRRFSESDFPKLKLG